jgi:hypothetical protein
MKMEKTMAENEKHEKGNDGSPVEIERLVKTKTENIERVIGRFYIEYLKLVRAGCPNNYGETDGFTDGMDKLAYAVIKREES